MRTAEIVRRSAVGIHPEQTAAEAAALMEQAGLGSLAVVDAGEGLVGIVTDRDLFRRVMARGLPLDGRIDGVMSAAVISSDADAAAQEAYRLFRSHAAPRPTGTGAGRFVGMI